MTEPKPTIPEFSELAAQIDANSMAIITMADLLSGPDRAIASHIADALTEKAEACAPEKPFAREALLRLARNLRMG